MSDTEKFINCPACGKQMKKVVIDNRKSFFVDVCTDGCGGIWLDNRELEEIDEKNEDISSIREILEGKTFKKADSSIKRNCPVCNIPMVKNYASIKKEVEIDECYNCGGKFLDNSELELIRSEYDSDEERTKDVLAASKDRDYMSDIFKSLLETDLSE